MRFLYQFWRFVELRRRFVRLAERTGNVLQACELRCYLSRMRRAGQ